MVWQVGAFLIVRYINMGLGLRNYKFWLKKKKAVLETASFSAESSQTESLKKRLLLSTCIFFKLDLVL